MVKIPLQNGTIPFPVTQKFKAAKIMLKPAPQGTGVIAGGAVRAVVEAAGVTDIVSKCLGSNNKMTNVFATFMAMQAIELLGEKQNFLKTK
jgi:small subunit ribosomal protein S5